jgi:hypothetical protein
MFANWAGVYFAIVPTPYSLFVDLIIPHFWIFVKTFFKVGRDFFLAP